MSEYAPGTFQFAERTMQLNVEESHRWARGERLRRQARAGGAEKPRFYFGFLASMGRRFAAWGAHLQERYSSVDSARITQSA
jgi:hypothetical protein